MILIVQKVSSGSESSVRVLHAVLGGIAEECLVFLREILLLTLIKTVSEYFHELFPVFLSTV